MDSSESNALDNFVSLFYAASSDSRVLAGGTEVYSSVIRSAELLR